MLMPIDSRQLLQKLLQRLTLEEALEEKEAILFWVLEHELNLSKTDILLGKRVIANDESLDKIIRRLNNHEPVQYILGEAWFYGRKFTINSFVLIPRPETEILVKAVIDRCRKKKILSILDIGTGSGCIAVSLALELPTAKVIATDISSDALSVAQRNADQMNTPVQFHRHDILSQSLNFGPLDVVVSNPPYVLNGEKSLMKRNVSDFEPHLALFVPNSNPLLFYHAIAEKAKHALKSGGFLITEINEQLGHQTASLFQANGFGDVKIMKDLSAKDRFVCGILRLRSV